MTMKKKIALTMVLFGAGLLMSLGLIKAFSANNNQITGTVLVACDAVPPPDPNDATVHFE
jgi:hypothetical protein